MDKFDEIAKKIIEVTGARQLKGPQLLSSIAQALRDVQRETAEECLSLAAENIINVSPTEYEWFTASVKKRFGLKD